MDDIEKAINDPDKEKSGQTGPTGPEVKPTEEEVRKAQALKELADIEAAKVAATAELQKVRAEKRQVKKAPTDPKVEVEKVIDENDPDAKPWINKIKESVSPLAEEYEKDKAEVFSLTLEEFLADRPSTAKSPEKLKEMMGLYDKIATGRTKEGMRKDLEKAYAATFHTELLQAARQGRVDEVRRDTIFSDVGVSRGSTAYTSPKEARVQLTKEEEKLAVQWYGSPEAFAKMKAEQDKKLEEAV